jgi:hypothetical protein
MSTAPGRIRILLYHVDNPVGEVCVIKKNLATAQALVGGDIEGHYVFPDVLMICNGNGIAEGLPINMNSARLAVPVPGPFFFVRAIAGTEVHLTDEDIARLRETVEGTFTHEGKVATSNT